ncbi:ferredoxin--NADP(+) reductase [Anaplasma phagocytophilum str. Norway variant2]|uniref:Ferredoxin--NADP reductase n=1 Tax=Anaplasma phagocytophilum str. Norway variant2 TaxID=1392507 RepID=A0A168HCD5_ANAPH|nr:NAD(P)/FAD-dependent oxidoreductase [Anaplasma phagocytophilum]ANC34327.1 ferredoxin--NADP(+) reductase [Anaplasma phagocytophilum str. Norway variant2]
MEYSSVFDVAIVGAGPVGLFTVFQAGMLGMNSCVIDALDIVGGQCAVLYPEKPIYDIPGYPMITAQDLVNNLQKQAEPFAPVYIMGQFVESISEGPDCFVLQTNKGTSVKCRAIIVAAGSGGFGPNRPPLDGIMEYENKSVFYNVSQMATFKNKKVVIAGGGDSAADWAVNLSEVADKLYVIHRRKSFRCAPNTLKKLEELADEGRINVLIPYQLAGLDGENGELRSVVVRNITTKEEISIEADFLLPFFGISANLGEIVNWGLGVEGFQIPVEQSTCRTRRSKIYAVGDIAAYPGKIKLILVGFSEAALACQDIRAVLFPDTPLNFQYSTSKGIPTL